MLLNPLGSHHEHTQNLNQQSKTTALRIPEATVDTEPSVPPAPSAVAPISTPLSPLPTVTEASALVAVTAAPSGNCAQYTSLFEQYNWPVATMMAIMHAESGCNPNAISPTNDYGLMQIHDGLALYGQQIFDPAFNISIAYQKYTSQGLHAWSTYTSGAYEKYL